MGCTLRISAAETIVAHAKREQPAECCGILLGRPGEILDAVPTRNLAGDPNRFLIDPEGHINARRAARGRGLVVLGFYHSHPHSPPAPSARDLAEATYESSLHLIVSLQSEPAVLRVFELADRGFVEVPCVEVP